MNRVKYRTWGADKQGNIYSFTMFDNSIVPRINKLTPHSDKNGYLEVGRKPIFPTRKVHRLVWIHFNGNIPSNMQINHINGIKNDNCLSNLELMTAKQNIYHAISLGLMSKPAKPIVCVTTGQKFRSIAEAALTLNIDGSSISKVLLGKYNQAGGYSFKEARKGK